MKREYMKYVDKPTWCKGRTWWGKNCEEYEELNIKDMNENEELYSDCHTQAFINTKEINEHITNTLTNRFDTKYVATLYFISENKKYTALKGVSIRLENRIKGDYIVYDETVLNGSRFGNEMCRVRMCENEEEVLQKLVSGNFEKLTNYNNLKFHSIDNIKEIKKFTFLNMLAISRPTNVVKNYIVEDITDEEKSFIDNLIIFDREIKNTHDYIKEYEEEGCISLKEVGERYSIKLANIMLELGYASWHFQDYHDLDKMKEQMINTINDDYYSEENAINHGSTKEKIIENINKCENEVLGMKAEKILHDLCFSYLENIEVKDNIEEEEEENEF